MSGFEFKGLGAELSEVSCMLILVHHHKSFSLQIRIRDPCEDPVTVNSVCM